MSRIQTGLAPGQVILVEAHPGEARSAALQGWLAAVQEASSVTWYLKADREEGPWSGLVALLRALLP